MAMLHLHLMALLEHTLELGPVEVDPEVLVVPAAKGLGNLVAKATLESILVKVLDGCRVHFGGDYVLLFDYFRELLLGEPVGIRGVGQGVRVV